MCNWIVLLLLGNHTRVTLISIKIHLYTFLGKLSHYWFIIPASISPKNSLFYVFSLTLSINGHQSCKLKDFMLFKFIILLLIVFWLPCIRYKLYL